MQIDAVRDEADDFLEARLGRGLRVGSGSLRRLIVSAAGVGPCQGARDYHAESDYESAKNHFYVTH
jgi:hypothetical protein